MHKVAQCSYGIWVGSQESQGFACQQALACDVPLLILDVRSMKEEYNHGQLLYQDHAEPLLATTVPYWSEKCGLRIYEPSEIIPALQAMETGIQEERFAPREFVAAELAWQQFHTRLLALMPQEPYLGCQLTGDLSAQLSQVAMTIEIAHQQNLMPVFTQDLESPNYRGLMLKNLPWASHSAFHARAWTPYSKSATQSIREVSSFTGNTLITYVTQNLQDFSKYARHMWRFYNVPQSAYALC